MSTPQRGRGAAASSQLSRVPVGGAPFRGQGSAIPQPVLSKALDNKIIPRMGLHSKRCLVFEHKKGEERQAEFGLLAHLGKGTGTR